MNQEIIEDVNRLNINNEIESAIKKKKKKKNSQQTKIQHLHRWIIPNIEQKLTSIFLKHLQKIRGKNVSELILWISITHIKIRKGQYKKLTANITDKHRAKCLYTILVDKIQKNIFKEPYGMIKWALSQEIQEGSIYLSK